jgi:hypothetical protein
MMALPPRLQLGYGADRHKQGGVSRLEVDKA